MKKAYSRPGLVEYGTVGALTLGSGGSLPDLDTNLNLINNTCPTAIDNGVTRVSCINASS